MDSYFGWGTIEDGWRKGPWTPQEDRILTEHVNLHGEGRWNSVSKLAGLRRSGKSCRLRWVNYLRPDLKRGKITPHEESIIVELHAKWGNRWSTIARSLPGRTDNEIKNYWRTHFKKGKSTKNVERARARFLRQQQKQLEDLRSEQQQQHQQILAYELAETMPCMAITDHQVEAEEIARDMHDIASNYYYCMQPLQLAQYATSTGASEAESSSEDGSWGSLWNLEDMAADVDQFMLQDQLFSFLY